MMIKKWTTKHSQVKKKQIDGQQKLTAKHIQDKKMMNTNNQVKTNDDKTQLTTKTSMLKKRIDDQNE